MPGRNINRQSLYFFSPSFLLQRPRLSSLAAAAADDDDSWCYRLI